MVLWIVQNFVYCAFAYYAPSEALSTQNLVTPDMNRWPPSGRGESPHFGVSRKIDLKWLKVDINLHIHYGKAPQENLWRVAVVEVPPGW